MKSLSVIFAACTMVLTAAANAQPFFGGGVVAFDPEISTVQTGVITDVQSTVSYDRKYVTITMNAQQSDLLALRPFIFQTPGAVGPPMGFVGDVAPVPPTPAPAAVPAVPAPALPGQAARPPVAPPPIVSNSPLAIERRAVASRSVLAQRGMFLLRVN